jgi:uncharacterized protein
VIRAVVDTNVFVAGALSPRGAPAEIWRRWRDGAFEIVVCPALVGELRRVFARPSIARVIAAEDARAIVDVLVAGALHRDDPEPGRRWSRDPDDDYLVALAHAAGAHVLVTGDRDLLEIEDAMLPIRSPRAFVDDLDALGPAPEA